MRNIGQIKLTQNKIIYRESEQDHYYYYLVDGTVRTYKSHPTNSNNITFQIIRKGNYFGYYELFSKDRKRNKSAEVISKNAIIQKYNIEELFIKSKEDHKFFYKLLLSSVHYNMQLWDRISVIRDYDKYRKIGWMLINIATPIDHKEEILEIKDYTHLLLSQYTASSRQTITAVLNEYRRIGIIEYDRNQILIKKSLIQKIINS